jgi:hypothetical protein
VDPSWATTVMLPVATNRVALSSCLAKSGKAVGGPKVVFQRDEAAALRGSRLPLPQIARKMGVGLETVRRVLRPTAVIPRPEQAEAGALALERRPHCNWHRNALAQDGGLGHQGTNMESWSRLFRVPRHSARTSESQAGHCRCSYTCRS